LTIKPNGCTIRNRFRHKGELLVSLITHITSRSMWQDAQQRGAYEAPSLHTEGFIHCSTPAQVAATANRFYRAQRGLLVLYIDPTLLTAPLKYEPGTDVADLFPHIYGPLNLMAIVRVADFEPDAAGDFHPPAEPDDLTAR
jgi:uncharacterized protein (DUF952 family)